MQRLGVSARQTGAGIQRDVEVSGIGNLIWAIELRLMKFCCEHKEGAFMKSIRRLSSNDHQRISSVWGRTVGGLPTGFVRLFFLNRAVMKKNGGERI